VLHTLFALDKQVLHVVFIRGGQVLHAMFVLRRASTTCIFCIGRHMLSKI